MPSIIEVDTIKNKTGTQNTVLSTDGSGNNTISVANIKANDGTAGLSIANSTGAITALGGIANAGTISAGTFNGTVGLTATNTVGWQHIQTFHHTSSSTDTGEIYFNNVFTNDYIMFHLRIGYWNVAENPFDINFRFTSGGNSPVDHNDSSYYSYHREHSHGDADYEITRQNGDSFARLVNNAEGNHGAHGIAGGEIYFYSVTAPTVLGTAADRGNVLHPFARGYVNHFHQSSSGTTAGYGSTEFDIRFNAGHDASDYTGLHFWCVNGDNTAGRNLMDNTHMALFGLKVKATS